MSNIKSIWRTVRVLGLAATFAAGAVAQGEAAPIVSISPASQTANVGDLVAVDIVVSGLTEGVGGYSISLLFDSSIVTGGDYGNDPGGKLGPAGLDLSGGFAGGSLDLFYVADETWDANDLAAAQGAGFVLASLTFTAVANGVSPFTLDAVDLSDANGDALLARGTGNGRVCVGGQCPVPEPGSMMLVLAGAASLVARRYTLRHRA